MYYHQHQQYVSISNVTMTKSFSIVVQYIIAGVCGVIILILLILIAVIVILICILKCRRTETAETSSNEQELR